jgi:hypothetical protein
MQAIATVLVLVSLASADVALASGPDQEAVRSGATGDWDPITLQLRLTPMSLDYVALQDETTRLYWLPEQLPDGLVLDVPVHEVLTLFLSADLDAVLPRIDSVDGETYFSVGAQGHLSSWLSVFVEDFMAAAAVIGSDEDREVEPIAARSWDGHQIAAGLLFTPHEQLTVRAEARGYLLSESKRTDGLGGLISVGVTF